MDIILAPSAGFCFGVKRALDTVQKEIDKKTKKIYTYGPIIHNEIVVKGLEEQGVEVISEETDLSKIKPGVIIIRSHGVSKKTIDELKSYGFDVINATCPFVQKIQKTVNEYDKMGYHIVIVGDPEHPEVQGIIGWIESGKYNVISTDEEATNLPFKKSEKVCLVSQTTFNFKKFEELVEIINKKGYDLSCLNTICNATEARQKEASEIADKVDVMIVIGGKHSSNSRKLYEICRAKNQDTYFIQSVKDLDLSLLQSIDSVGITAGASTPNNIIEEVQGTCQKRALNRC
ncbi:MAG: 4-hydroxy-3-methylbut-2-enyl diphosphate reductase [Lachnospiraceae bacterium]|jgi:4-hydroxy-3-methylbut-2-enyl diphosphate reductase|nr:4-hydroxy-3-methylbut-2-enyl diphosphate reductase [Lachnospiraceae bacterium]